MATIKTYEMQNSAILRINAEKDLIDTAPEYQRRGEVWDLPKKQLLIDSVLNDYDIPKLYFHIIPTRRDKSKKKNFKYAIIDGRQRLETIWKFIEGKIRLDDDFIYLPNKKIKAGGLNYKEISEKYPDLKIQFDSRTLPIILVETSDIELIEEMFSRLNEAVPLNAAEKRNALGGVMAITIKNLTRHKFFLEKIKFSDKRYQHREVSARLLFIEYSLQKNKKIIDTKKPYLDSMVKDFRTGKSPAILKARVSKILSVMNKIFLNNDILLRSQSSIPIYYLVFKSAHAQNKINLITRRKLITFFETIDENRIIAEDDISKANFELLEYDRMSQQGTNDASSIRERVGILSDFLNFKSDYK